MPSLNEYDLTSPSFFAAPDDVLRRLRDEAPVYWDASLEAFVLTRYEDVSQALRDPKLSVDRGGKIGRSRDQSVRSELAALNEIIGTWMVFVDPPRHTRLRKAVAHAFQPQFLDSLASHVSDTVGRLLRELSQQDTFDALSQLAQPVAESTTAHLLGIDGKGQQLKEWTKQLFALVGAADAQPELILSSVEGVNECRRFIRRIVRARKEASQRTGAFQGRDLVTQLVSGQASEFTEEDVVGLIITLLAGAYETTAYAIVGCLHALLTHPRQLALLKANPTLVESAVEESLRYCGPALGVQRRAMSDFELGNSLIEQDSRLYCILHSANRDPRAFDDPDRFDISRRGRRQLGFGLGTHFCIGAWLSRLEIQTAVEMTLAAFPNLGLAEDHPVLWQGNFAMRGLKELVLRSNARSFEQSVVSQGV